MTEQVEVKPSAFPVYSENSKRFFVDPHLVLPTVKLVNGVAVMTAPLAVNKSFDLIGISLIETELDGGRMNETDRLDKEISVVKLYVQSGEGVVTEYPVADITTEQVSIPRAPLDDMILTLRLYKQFVAKIRSNQVDYTAIIEIMVMGSISRDIGTCEILSGKPRVISFACENGAGVVPPDPRYAELLKKAAEIKVIGYDLNYNFKSIFGLKAA